jgi:signal transduction histidine kinase
MFNKTRIRLTLLNAAVFFLIIACIGAIVYTELRHQLYTKVDESLRMRIQQDSTNLHPKLFISSNETESPAMERTTKRTVIQVQGIDPRVFLVLWDDQGNLFPILAGPDNKKAVDAFRPYRSIKAPQTVKVDGHSYRLYSMDYDEPVLLDLPQLPGPFASPIQDVLQARKTEPSKIVSVQAISIIDSEVNMLKQLMNLILFGIVGGGAVTVLAGLILANQALQPIKRAWDTQQRFVADASHELRMPLSIIQANAELVFRHPERSILDMSEPLSMVLSESKRMGVLTSQLLTLARADSNQEEIALKPVSLTEVIREVLQKFAPIAELKLQRLEGAAENGLELLGDRDRLHQLLVILLDNSMKFTPEQGTVRVDACRRGHHIELVVEDTGEGIAAEDLPHIFDRFFRGDKSRNRSGGGTGLGLAIAKWIVNKHKGEISSASVLGQGTKIMIRFPASKQW